MHTENAVDLMCSLSLGCALKTRLAVIAILALASSAALADEGEVAFDFVFAPEVASTVHPAVDGAPLSDQATTIFKPRTALGVRYGLTNDLYVGIAGSVAASTSIRTPTVTIEESTGDLLTAQYLELSAPVLFGWRFDSGSFMSGAAELELAPLAVYWGVQDLVDFTDVDEAGLPASLEKQAPDTWQLGGLARLTVLFNTRLFDVVGLDIGPSLAVSWAGDPAVHVGLTMRPSFIWGGSL
jgi:hypothetical protein